MGGGVLVCSIGWDESDVSSRRVISKGVIGVGSAIGTKTNCWARVMH